MQIITIGGGSMIEGASAAIDKEVVSFSGKKFPNALFIPTASSDDLTYRNNFKIVYGQRLKCKTDELLLLQKNITKKAIAQKINWADIIYVGGGNTLKLMKRWRFLGVDEMLLKAANDNKVLTGSSAGALCWASYGHSDSMAYYHPQNWDYIKVKCLGMIPVLLCPHYLKENRDKSFKAMVNKTGGFGIALDDCSAMQIKNNKVRFIQSNEKAFAFHVKKQDQKIVETKLPINEWFNFEALKSM